MRDRSFQQDGTSKLDDLIFKFRAHQALSNLPTPAPVVVDLGSGYEARFLRFALRTGRIRAGIAVDVSLDVSREDVGIELIESDLSKPLSIGDSSVDAVTSLAVVEHLDDPTVHLSEMYRILRSGGVAILTTPTTRAKPVLELLAFRLHVIDAAEILDHKRYYTERQLRTLHIRAGFAEKAISYRSFEFGMNQLVVAVKGSAADRGEGSGLRDG